MWNDSEGHVVATAFTNGNFNLYHVTDFGGPLSTSKHRIAPRKNTCIYLPRLTRYALDAKWTNKVENKTHLPYSFSSTTKINVQHRVQVKAAARWQHLNKTTHTTPKTACSTNTNEMKEHKKGKKESSVRCYKGYIVTLPCQSSPSSRYTRTAANAAMNATAAYFQLSSEGFMVRVVLSMPSPSESPSSRVFVFASFLSIDSAGFSTWVKHV